jgi:signal transduction histidine kinase
MRARTLFQGLVLRPRTLRSRLFLIVFLGLIAAQGLSFALLFTERYMSAESIMLDTLDGDIATAVAILNRVPAAERDQWLTLLDRRNYQYVLGPGLPGLSDLGPHGAVIAATIRNATRPHFPVEVQAIPGDDQRLQAHLTFSDGAPLTIDIRPSLMPIAQWLPYVLIGQFLLLVLCSWFAVRLAIRPLVSLADAANALDPNKSAPRLSETGPREVAYAAAAFNSMRDRIAQYLEERVQILAAISHDLQTPITRMKLRAEIAEDSIEKEKLIQDLAEIERLVHEGVDYARSAHGRVEKASRIDIGSFVESLVYDYQDTGKSVTIAKNIEATIVTRPHALRRILTNLIDNAIKFAGSAEVSAEKDSEGLIIMKVLDRGPGIPEEQLNAVLQPFFRLEQSRSRGSGGAGLGLAIAYQLSVAIEGRLALLNRPDGGLSAEISLEQSAQARRSR